MPKIIPYPKIKSEFEVQSKLFQKLKNLGYDARGEVPLEGTGRVELVIFENRIAKIIIEVKSKLYLKQRGKGKTKVRKAVRRKRIKNILRYRLHTEIPVIVCIGMICIPETLHHIHRIVSLGLSIPKNIHICGKQFVR